MRAVYYDAFGPAEVLKAGDLPVPEPRRGQVLIKVAAAAVNPIDRRLRAGELQPFFQRTFPIVPGWDASGRIVKIGAGVRGWEIGEAVAALAFSWQLQHGTYAEYVPVAASAIARIPPGLSFAQAAALPLVSLTAWQAVVEEAELQEGQSILIQAGAGGVGSAAIPIASSLGARVYTTARGENFRYVQARGAAHVIDYTQENYLQAVRRLEPEGVDVVVESLEDERAVNGALDIVKPGGSVIYLNNEPPASPAIAQRKIHSLFLHHRADGAMLGGLLERFAHGAWPLPEIETLPLSAAIDAHRRSESWRTRGKLVLEVAAL
jgi:NADPH2:quinone reductase